MRSGNRRQFLRTALGSAGAALCSGALAGLGGAAAAQTRSSEIGVAELRGNLLQVSGAGGNVVLFGDGSGVAMVDSGAAEHVGSIVDIVRERFDDAAVELLFNTHWHLGHTGGNDTFGQRGAQIIAHENTRLWMSTQFHVEWLDRTFTPRAPAAIPTRTFFSSDPQPVEAEYAGLHVEYAHLREAHTDGDIYVRFPELNVIVAGGAVSVGRYPVLDYMTGGLIRGLISATEALLELSDADTLIVPAAGPAQRRAHLQAQRDMLVTMLERVQALANQGRSAREMLAAGITEDFDDYWGDNAARFVHNVYQGLWGINL